MDSKIFLGKYHVSSEEIGAVGEPSDSPLAYEGEEIESGKKVVVELVPAASLTTAARGQLEAKAMAAKKLTHLNIPALYDFGVQGDDLVYVTEDFDGTLAEEWVKTNGPMPVGPVLRIASQVVSALGAAAFHRIAHRALNPSNLVLVPGQTAEGEWPLVKVLHFVGGALRFPGNDVAVAASDNSSHYTSPEQLQHGTVDFRAEIYSLGATMWFLLTGAPPLLTPTGPTTAQPTTTGRAVDKMSAVPKSVRRLLDQMLSVNPDARPRDPLAFYRQLQDCLSEVERRETITHTVGVPVLQTAASGRPRSRRNPLKALARAALFLAMAALAALLFREYVQHRRVVHEEEPIGVPIGVSDAFASATPVNAKVADPVVSVAATPTALVVDSHSTESVPAKSAGADSTDALPTASDSGESVSSKPAAVAAVEQTTPYSPPNLQIQEPAPVTASNAGTPPAQLSEVAATTQVEITPSGSTEVEASAATPPTAPTKIIMHEVRRAEPAEPEVRRAEPAPPEEGPTDGAPGTSAEQSPGVEAAETPSRAVKRKHPEPKIPAKTTEQTIKPKRPTEEAIYLPRPVR